MDRIERNEDHPTNEIINLNKKNSNKCLVRNNNLSIEKVNEFIKDNNNSKNNFSGYRFKSNILSNRPNIPQSKIPIPNRHQVKQSKINVSPIIRKFRVFNTQKSNREIYIRRDRKTNTHLPFSNAPNNGKPKQGHKKVFSEISLLKNYGKDLIKEISSNMNLQNDIKNTLQENSKFSKIAFEGDYSRSFANQTKNKNENKDDDLSKIFNNKAQSINHHSILKSSKNMNDLIES
jgi:hypothetical protein